MKRVLLLGWLLLSLQTLYALTINEVLVRNTYTKLDPDHKEYSSWIELYNENDFEENLADYYISDDHKESQKWHLPDVIIKPHSFILIWADKNAHGLHTNFGLKSEDEDIVLSKGSGEVVQSIHYPKQKRDISFSFDNNKIVYMIPTPGYLNGKSYALLERAKTPEFSLQEGFYTDSVTLELKGDPGEEFYYTLDGSIPTKNALKYTHPIFLNHTTVIRVIGYQKESLPSKIVSATFFINENSSLPVFSLIIDPEFLYDRDSGIYTNYEKDWTRTGDIALFRQHQLQFNEKIGARIFGNNSRTLPQKSLAIFFKDKFGKKSLKYPLFYDKPKIKKVKSFVLRNGGTAFGRELISDAVQQRVIKGQMDIDFQSYEPAILFLNGKYWGIYNIREKLNEDYIEANHGVDDKKIDFLENHMEIKRGSAKDFLELKSFIETHDLSIDSNYKYVESKVDIDELINYFIIESYGGNGSVDHNLKYWKEEGDSGKWRWLLFDLDRGFRYDSAPVFKYIKEAYALGFLFDGLIQNHTFVQKFLSRYYTHINTTFANERLLNIIQQMRDKISPEVARHFKKWSKGRHNEDATPETWNGFMDKMVEYVNGRDYYVKKALEETFGVLTEHRISFEHLENGSIIVDGVVVNQSLNAHYFHGATITVEAKPNDGYRFVRWSSGLTNQEINLTINQDQQITPIFEKSGIEDENQSLALTNGWNLIGINANLTLDELKSQLEEDNLLIITAGNGENYKKILGTRNRFKEFKDKVGYLVKLQKNATLKFTPKVYQDNTIDLVQGWNLINPLGELSIAKIKQQLGDKLLVISGGDNQYYKSTLGSRNRFIGFKEPYGYWVKVSSDAQLKF